VIAPLRTDLEVTTHPLSPAEKSRLGQLELVVEKNLTGFIQAGHALLEIQRDQLWRGSGYDSFVQYARERFGLAGATAFHLTRAARLYDHLRASSGADDADTPVSPQIPEGVLRPLVALPTEELQAQGWRLAAKISPAGRPTPTITRKVARMVRESIGALKTAPSPKRELMFVRPIHRLAQLKTFRSDLACSHVTKAAQARGIDQACETVINQCREVQAHLRRRFPNAYPLPSRSLSAAD
jgi:hypothetical protein